MFFRDLTNSYDLSCGKLNGYELGSLQSVKIPVVENLSLEKPNSYLPINVAYPVRDDLLFLKGIYVSILSQIANADFLQVGNVALFVPERCYELAENLFSGLLTHLSISIYKRKAFRKHYGFYRLTRRSILRHGLVRSEGPYVTPSQFFFLKDSPPDFYKKLQKFLINKKLICGVESSKKESLYREFSKNGFFYDFDEYLSLLKRFEKKLNKTGKSFLKRKKWLGNNFVALPEGTLKKGGDLWNKWKEYESFIADYQLHDLGVLLTPFLTQETENPIFLNQIFEEKGFESLNIAEDKIPTSYLIDEIDQIINKIT